MSASMFLAEEPKLLVAVPEEAFLLPMLVAVELWLWRSECEVTDGGM